MDSDGETINKIKAKRGKINFIQRYLTNVGNVLSTIWIRRPIQIDNGYQWIILDSRCRFLFNFRFFLVMLYISYEIFK